MAHITGTSFELVQAIAPISGLANLETAVIGGTRYVYASRNFAGSDVQIYSVADDGTLTLLGNVPDTASIALNGAWGTNTFTLGTDTYLAVAGQQDDGVSVFKMLADAPYLEHVDTIFDSESTEFDLEEARWVAPHQVGGNTYLTVGMRSDTGGITVLQVASDGTLSFAAKYEGEIDNSIYRGWPSELFEVNGTHYFMVMDPQGTNWSIMSIDPATGALTLEVTRAGFDVTRFDNSGQASFHVENGVPYLFVPSVSDAALYVYTYAGGDSVSLVTSIVMPAALDGAAKSQVYMVGDTLLVAVGSQRTTAGVQIFEFDLATETLIPLQQLSADEGVPGAQLLNDVTFGPTNYDVDGKPYAMIMGDNDAALNVYAIGGGADDLTGTVDADLIEGFGGNDTMVGLAGDDTMHGGEGDDTLGGGGGNDMLEGGEGDDILNGSSGDDQLSGGDGNDEVNGGTGNDIMNGGAGDDTMRGFAGNDRMFGEAGHDVLKGGAGADFIQGGADNDDINGESGNDTLFGQDGLDTIRGGGGNDTLDGGSGQDSLFGGSGNDFINAGSGHDTVAGDAGDDKLFGGAGNDDISGGTGADLLKGNAGNDILSGGADNDTLVGQSGNDTLNGDGGDDTLQGGGGRDRLNGGGGDDSLSGGTGEDVFVFDTIATGGGGTNTITDFTDGIDRLDLVSYGYADAAAALSGAVQDTANVRLTLSDGQIVVIENTQTTDLDGTDLILI